MKKQITIAVIALCISIAAITVLTAFKKADTINKSEETCTQWDGNGIQFRQCATDWGLKSHQFFNGYRFKVWVYFKLNFTDGGYTTGNRIIDADTEGYKASNDGNTGTNKVVENWQILKKEKQDSNGKWVEF